MGADSNKIRKKDVVSKKHEKCRICGKKEMISYLNLGNFPLANNLFKTQKEATEAIKYPLEVLFCQYCNLSQLSEVVDPRVLFSHYRYKSGISKGYINHCRDMAKEFKKEYKLIPYNSLLIDVAGNDCTLLEQFKEEIPGLRLLNIDPAKNLCEICREKGIDAVSEFLSVTTATDSLLTYGLADIITATNVIAHVHSVRQFFLSVKIMLRQNGVFVLEFPYIIPHIENLEYPTLYHEHLSYIGITPLSMLCEETDMKIIKVEEQDIHCGTVRVTIAHDISWRTPEDSVQEFINKEKELGFNDVKKYESWNSKVNININEIISTIKDLKSQGKTIHAMGCSAKGNTLLNACNFTSREIEAIYDDTPEKQGMYSPGTGIPVLSVDKLKESTPDYIIILAWNFTKEIKKRLEGVYFGKYIIPVPNVIIE